MKIQSVKTVKTSGFTLVEIMIVVAIIALLAAIAVPNFVRARNTSQRDACIENLRQIDWGKQQWAVENRKSSADSCSSDDVKTYIKLNSFPHCPAGGSYTLGVVGEDPVCSLAGAQSH